MTNPEIDTTKDEAAAYASLKDKMGRFRTQSLFIEYKNDKYPAPFTLKDVDHKGAVSMRMTYLDISDPTEYSTAIALLGPQGWRHWCLLVECKWFKPHIKRWRNELKMKFESDRFQEMQLVAINQNGTPAGVAATKWLADRYSNKGSSPKRGRPSQDEKDALLREESAEDQLLAEEATRIGLK